MFYFGIYYGQFIQVFNYSYGIVVILPLMTSFSVLHFGRRIIFKSICLYTLVGYL